jgi:hypothetical protein
VLLIVGIALIVVGVTDYAMAALLARNQSAGAPGGLGAGAAPPPAARILKLTGAVTVAAGVVLVAVGLAT